MLHDGLVEIGKTYVPQLVTSTITPPLLNKQGVDLNMFLPLDGSAPPCEILSTTTPLLPASTRLVLLNKEAPIQDVLDRLTFAKILSFNQVGPIEATKHNYKFDGEFFHLYPKYARSSIVPYQMCGDTFIFVFHILHVYKRLPNLSLPTTLTSINTCISMLPMNLHSSCICPIPCNSLVHNYSHMHVCFKCVLRTRQRSLAIFLEFFKRMQLVDLEAPLDPPWK